MKKIILISMTLLLVHCITDEKTNCYSEEQKKNQKGFILSPCNAWLITASAAEFLKSSADTKESFRQAAVIGCLNDELVYRKCKNKSQIKPVPGTGDGIE